MIAEHHKLLPRIIKIDRLSVWPFLSSFAYNGLPEGVTMASKKENLVPGLGCISCAHNKDINLYKDMYKKSTEKIPSHAEEGTEFFKNLMHNSPSRTECRFYNSDDGLLCEYFVERDYCRDDSCPDYLPVKFEKAPVSRSHTITDEEREPAEGEIREVESEDEEEEFSAENENDEPIDIADDENYTE